MKINIQRLNRMAWPGKAEMLYFIFTICRNPLRAFKTSTADYMLAVEYSDILKDWEIRGKPKIILLSSRILRDYT